MNIRGKALSKKTLLKVFYASPELLSLCFLQGLFNQSKEVSLLYMHITPTHPLSLHCKNKPAWQHLKRSSSYKTHCICEVPMILIIKSLKTRILGELLIIIVFKNFLQLLALCWTGFRVWHVDIFTVYLEAPG